jgi:hypothetical protein
MNKNKIPTNKQIVKALKQSLLRLSDGVEPKGRSSYICFAVHNTKASLFVKDHISRNIIMPRLNGCASLNGWLISRGINLNIPERKKLLQLHRKAWVLKLIEEFSDGH